MCSSYHIGVVATTIERLTGTPRKVRMRGHCDGDTGGQGIPSIRSPRRVISRPVHVFTNANQHGFLRSVTIAFPAPAISEQVFLERNLLSCCHARLQHHSRCSNDFFPSTRDLQKCPFLNRTLSSWRAMSFRISRFRRGVGKVASSASRRLPVISGRKRTFFAVSPRGSRIEWLCHWCPRGPKLAQLDRHRFWDATALRILALTGVTDRDVDPSTMALLAVLA